MARTAPRTHQSVFLRRPPPPPYAPSWGPYWYGGIAPVRPSVEGAPRRWVLGYISAFCGGAATGTPERARWMSVRISAADWYRSAGSLAIAFSTIESAQAGISGSTRDGG